MGSFKKYFQKGLIIRDGVSVKLYLPVILGSCELSGLVCFRICFPKKCFV